MNNRKVSIFILAGLFLVVSIKGADITNQVTEVEIKIQIPQVEIQPLSLLDTIPIYFESSIRIGGFDLKIESSLKAMFSIVDIIPGEFSDSCKWELFSSKSNLTTDAENKPIKVWKIVSLPEVIPDEVRPLCRQLSHKAVLCRLIVSINKQLSDKTNLGDISFYWEACRDNLISSESGGKLYLSKKISDSTGRNGAPENCISNRTKDKLIRAVTFVNGSLTRAVIDSTFFEPDSLSN